MEKRGVREGEEKGRTRKGSDEIWKGGGRSKKEKKRGKQMERK